MKINNFLKISLFAATAFAMVSCEDEVLVRTQDTTRADALLNEIAVVENQRVTVDLENSELTISNSRLEALLDSLSKVRHGLNESSAPTTLDLTVNVLSSAGTVFGESLLGRTNGMSGASVVVEQNGLVMKPSSHSAGLYLFTGLTNGSAYVRVSAPDHTGVEMTIQLGMNFDKVPGNDMTSNGAVQVVLYPVAGELAATIKGMAYANRSTLNDTINRKYGSATAFGEFANTFISPVGLWDMENYTQRDDQGNRGTIYSDYFPVYNSENTFSTAGHDIDGPSGNEVAFEMAVEGHKIYAVPQLRNLTINNDYENNGYITSITYKGLITSATIAADGSYILPIPAGSSSQQLFQAIELITEPMVASHTRLTAAGGYGIISSSNSSTPNAIPYYGNYNGQQNEEGSEELAFSYYNNSDNFVTIFTGGNESTMIEVSPAEKVAIKRRVITETWEYRAYFLNRIESQEDDRTLDRFPSSGSVITRNIYFFPNYLPNRPR